MGGTSIGGWPPLLPMLLLLFLFAASDCAWSAAPPAIMTPFLLLWWSETLPFCAASEASMPVARGGSRCL